MDASNPEFRASRLVIPRALLAGGALGALCIACAGLVLYDTAGLLAGATGLSATILASLVVGLWAGTPAADESELPYAARWISAGIATAVAGGFATFLTLYGGVGGEVATRVVSLLALIAAPVYTIGMLLPVLLLWGERLEERANEEDYDPAHWSILGAITLGTLAGTVLGVVAAGVMLVTWLGPGPLLLGLAVLLFAPVLLPDPEIATTNERLLAELHTPLSHIRVTEVVFPGARQPERRLYLGDEQESGQLVRSGVPTLAYIMAAESWLSGTPPRSSYLFLGGGAYTLPRRIAERDPNARVTVVELDAEVTQVAARFFGLRRDHGIQTVFGDARAFLDSDDRKWDRIYLDVYAGTETLPYPMVTAEAFHAAAERLAPDGLIGVNLIGIVSGQESAKLWSVVRTIGEVFPAVAVYAHLGADYPDRQNVLVIASQTSHPDLGRQMGHFERWPASDWPDGGTMVFRDLFASPAAQSRMGEREGVR
jgi:spermidine synthase